MRLGMRKLSLPAIMATVGMFAVVASGCGPTSTTSSGPAKAKDQILHYAAGGGGATDVATLDPGAVQDSVSIPWITLMFDGLVTLDKNLNVEPWGADKMPTVSSDGLTYTFHLRANQAFSDGTPVKASDYAYAMDRSQNPCYASPVANYLGGLKDAATFSGESCTADKPVGSIQTLIGDSIVADDSAGTLTLTLQAPAGYFLEALTYPTSFAIEKSVISGSGLGTQDKWLDQLTASATHPTGQGGSGMYYISSWDHNGVLNLKQNPNWWGLKAGKKPNLTEIDVKFFASSDTEYSTYTSGTQYDFVDTIPSAQIAAAKSQPDYHQAPALVVGGFRLNWKVAPFDNLDARQAFCLSINRDLYNTSVAQGNAIPSYHLVPNGMPGYDANLKNIDGTTTTGDVTKAKAHWQAYLATLGGKAPPTITYSYNTGSKAAQNAADFFQGAWKDALGVAVQYNAVTFPTLLKEEQGKKLQIYRWAWGADYPDPQDFLTLLYDTNSIYNENNDSIPAADAMMEKADNLASIADRVKLYNQAEQMLVDQVAGCDITQAQSFYRVRTYVAGGLTFDAQAEIPNDAWVSAYIAQH